MKIISITKTVKDLVKQYGNEWIVRKSIFEEQFNPPLPEDEFILESIDFIHNNKTEKLQITALLNKDFKIYGPV